MSRSAKAFALRRRGDPDRRRAKALAERSDRTLPAWAQAADFLFLALVAIAATVAASGGSRVTFGEWRVSLTSSLRPLLAAAVVIAVRHLVSRQSPIHVHVFARVKAWSRSTALRTALAASAGTRPAIFCVGFMAVVLFGYAGGAAPWRDSDNELLNLPLRWDAGWYLQIAIHEYSFVHQAGPEFQQNIVFFPAYPMAVRALAMILGENKLAYVASGTAISLAAFLFALTYLFLLAREYLDEEGAAAAVWMLAAYPFAIFYGAIYTESLFLLASLGAFYHFRREEYVRAGVWGLIVGLTRPNGIFLSVPLALLAVSGANTRYLAAGLVAAAMCGVGTLIYSAFIWNLTGHPLTWAVGHAAWGRHYQGLLHLVTERYDVIRHAGLYSYAVQSPYDLLNGLGALFVLAAALPVWRRFGLPFAVFIVINMLPPLATGGLLSAGRFSAVLFPAFMWLASVVRSQHRAGWIASFATLQALNASLFYTWRPLY
jgi:hypothetical protein